MTKNLDLSGLRSIADNYDLFYIDLWGVIHNGLKLNEDAIQTLHHLKNLKKEFVLLTNAPRPNLPVQIFLNNMGMDKLLQKYVFTSGEAALKFLKLNHNTENFFHLGPPKDNDLFKEFTDNKKDKISEADYILCTGLFENKEDLIYYKKFLENYINKKMICTNPDLIVDKGDKRELCAGSVAMVFEKLGGKVIYFGKPYAEVYNLSIENKNKRILSIGDNLNTDIKGANLLNYDSLLISNGIHKNEINERGIKEISKQYETIVNYIQSDLKW